MKRILFVAVVLAQTGNYLSPVSAKPKVADEDDVRETVFRYQLHPPKPRVDPKYSVPRLPNGKKPYSLPYKVFFLSIENDKDPSDTFMARFAGHNPPIKKASQGEWNPKFDPKHGSDKSNAAASYAYRDKATGEPGKIYSVDKIKWLRKNRVIVEGSYHSGGRSAGGYIYSVIRKNGKWIVENSTGTWIS